MCYRLSPLFYFAADVFHETFKSLSHVKPDVLYPIPDFAAFNRPTDPPTADLMPTGASTTFVSINRYERKKNLGLAIQALGLLIFQCLHSSFLKNYI